MQTTRGRSEQERKESVEKSDQIQGTRGKVSCVAWAGILTESMRSLCGLHDPQDPGRAQLAPCSLFLAPRACLVALLSCGQVQVTTESPLRLRCRLLRPLHLFLSTVGWTGARRASGEVLAVLGGSPAVTLQSMLQSLGPGSHLGTSGSELRWGLEPRGLQGERKCRRECVQPPKCRAAGKG